MDYAIIKKRRIFITKPHLGISYQNAKAKEKILKVRHRALKEAIRWIASLLIEIKSLSLTLMTWPD